MTVTPRILFMYAPLFYGIFYAMHHIRLYLHKFRGLSCSDGSASHYGFNCFLILFFTQSLSVAWRTALFMHHWQGASCFNRCCWRLVAQLAWQCCYCSQADKTVVDYVFCCNAACGVQLLWKLREFRFLTTWFCSHLWIAAHPWECRFYSKRT